MEKMAVLLFRFCLTFFACARIANAIVAPYEEIDAVVASYTLPQLPFGDSDLEPYIDSATLKAHHRGHHQTYTTNLNKILTEWRAEDGAKDLSQKSILTILQSVEKVPANYRRAIINQGGGFINHCIYWNGMSSNPSSEPRLPAGRLAQDINTYFGSYQAFQEKFTAQAKTLFGSGYVWLSRKPSDVSRTASASAELVITTTMNQDSPVSEGFHPILVLDVWEHAYYLKHQFRRAAYIQDWWQVVDWRAVAQLDQWWAQISKDEL